MGFFMNNDTLVIADTERKEAINNVCNDLGIMLGTSHDRIDAAIDSMLKLGYHNGPKMGEEDV